MKRLIYTVMLIVGLSVMTMAQDIELKVMGGINTSHLTTEHVDWKTQGRVGYQFGAAVLVGEKLYFEPGVFFNTISKDVYDANNPDSASFKNTINAIRIPVHIGYHILGSEETFADLRVFAGFGANMITSVKNDSDDLSKDDFKNFILDFNAGVGVDIWIFFIEWNYMLGLTPVFVDGSDAKVQAFYGNIGARIRF
jgi:hypothetical protein